VRSIYLRSWFFFLRRLHIFNYHCSLCGCVCWWKKSSQISYIVCACTGSWLVHCCRCLGSWYSRWHMYCSSSSVNSVENPFQITKRPRSPVPFVCTYIYTHNLYGTSEPVVLYTSTYKQTSYIYPYLWHLGVTCHVYIHVWTYIIPQSQVAYRDAQHQHARPRPREQAPCHTCSQAYPPASWHPVRENHMYIFSIRAAY